jgi:hypothetical protein
MTLRPTRLGRRAILAGMGAAALGGVARRASALTLPSPINGPSLPVNAADPPFNAKGNGSADDTTALNAAIASAIANRRPCYIPATGNSYRITAPLIVGGSYIPGTAVQGFRLYGDGPGQGTAGGTEILYTGDAGTAVAILNIGAQLWRRCSFENFAVRCSTLRGATAGLYFNSTEFSQHSVKDVSVDGCAYGFQIDAGTGANGEFIDFTDVHCYHVDRVFRSNAGQAFQQKFTNLTATLNTGGIYFEFVGGVSSGGFGLDVRNLDASGIRTNGIANTTLLALGGLVDSPVTIEGGRIEHLTQLFSDQGGSPNLALMLTFRGLEIGVDYDPTNGSLRLPVPGGFVVGGSNSDNVLVEGCKFFADATNADMPIDWNMQWNRLRFRQCAFVNFKAPPHLLPSGDASGSVAFRDCQVGIANKLNRPYTFNRSLSINEPIGGGRIALPGGRNLLTVPQVCSTRGDNVRADSPWVQSGTLGAYDNLSVRPPVPVRSSLATAKALVLSPGTVLYQDITSLDLSRPAAPETGLPPYRPVEENATYVAYQALVNYFTGGALRVSLIDSVSGQVYDKIEINTRGGSGVWQLPVLVTLSAVIAQTGSTSYPRFKYESIGSGSADWCFDWQFLTNDPLGPIAQ